MLWPVSRVFGAPLSVFDELRRLQRDMNRAFEGTFGSYGRAVFPAVNVSTDKDTAVVTAELPGIDPKDLDISVQHDTLILAGKRPAMETAEGELLHRQERFSGEFVRTVELPCRVDADHVEATYATGVLTIRLPRAAEDKPKSITVNVN